MDSPYELIVNTHKGVLRGAAFPNQERGLPENALEARDVTFDQVGNAYVAHGMGILANTPIANVANVTAFYYSPTLGGLLIQEGTTVYLVDPNTGATLQTFAAAFTNGVFTSFTDWPDTGHVYGADGVFYKKLTAAGVLTDVSGTAPLGIGKILITAKGRIWSAIVAGQNPNIIFPSAGGDPEAFGSGDGIRCAEGGKGINALSTLNNALFVHKDFTIHGIFGTTNTNFERRDLNTGHGAVDKQALYTSGRVDYFVAKDGCYRTNGQERDLTTKYLGPLVGDRMVDRTGTPITGGASVVSPGATVVPLVPLWMPDYGKNYMLYNFQLGQSSRKELWRLEVESGNLVQLCANNTFQWKMLAHARDRLVTYALDANSNNIFFFGDFEKYGTEDIVGEYVTQQIDAGMPNRCKTWDFLNQMPIDDGATLLGDVDGLGIYPWDLKAADGNEANQTGFNLGRELVGYNLSILARRTGGGKPLLGGFSLEAQVLEARKGRSYGASRSENVDKIMTDAPPYKVGVEVLAGGEASVTITHNLGYVPYAIIAQHEGWNPATTIGISSIGINSFVANLSAGSGAGDRVLWLVLKRPMIHLRDAAINGGRIIIPNTESVTIPHKLLFGSPTMILSQIRAGASPVAIQVTHVDANLVKLTPVAPGIDVHLFWVGFVQGTLDSAYFRAGSASASPITHGLGATPTVAFLTPNQAGMPAHGLTSMSSTQLVYSGAGAYSYAAVK